MKNRLWNALSLTLVALLLVTACSPAATPTTAPTDAAEATTAPEATEGSDFSFALVTPAPRGDRSFIDASIRGAEQAMEELGVEGTIVESPDVPGQDAAVRSALSQNPDLVLGLAIEPDVLLALAEEYPDQKFAVPSDIFVESLPDNVAAFQINVHESSYLVGVIAGMLTETKTVGAVVGGDSPGLNQFFWAYKQGVLSVCPDCNVLVSYLNFEFSNPTLGKETAVGQYEQGADIIFQVAGASGEGVISAAAERGLYAIGVDSNQDDIAPGNVIVSMMKRVDTSTYLLIKNTMEGNFTPGFSVIGMADGATGLSWDEGSTTFEENGPEAMTSKLPEVKAAVEEARAGILDGSVVVCNALTDPDAASAECAGLK
jgi:basic membrane protein A and related proteins